MKQNQNFWIFVVSIMNPTWPHVAPPLLVTTSSNRVMSITDKIDLAKRLTVVWLTNDSNSDFSELWNCFFSLSSLMVIRTNLPLYMYKSLYIIMLEFCYEFFYQNSWQSLTCCGSCVNKKIQKKVGPSSLWESITPFVKKIRILQRDW